MWYAVDDLHDQSEINMIMRKFYLFLRKTCPRVYSYNLWCLRVQSHLNARDLGPLSVLLFCSPAVSKAAYTLYWGDLHYLKDLDRKILPCMSDQ